MNYLCSQINNGYIANLKSITIPCKKKYLPILARMFELNLINSFFIVNSYKIKIVLKYYNNKPLIFLEQISSGGNKQYYKFKDFKKNYSKFFFNPILYSNNLGVLNHDEVYILKLGGKCVLKIHLLYKNIFY